MESRAKTRLTFHRGLRTIGGNLIELSYANSRIIFDFGTEYRPSAPQAPADLNDLIQQGYVPYLPGVFDRGLRVDGASWQPDTYEQTAVFVSHAHLDHSKMINFLDSDVPLYASAGTKAVLEAVSRNDEFVFPPSSGNAPHTRDIVAVEFGQTVQVGDIAVTIMQVDHDAYGASGFRIETPDSVVAYTGDIRFHGFLADATRAFLQASAGADALIMESTQMSFQAAGESTQPNLPKMSEQGVVEDIAAAVTQASNRQVTFNYYLTNIERIAHLINNVPRQTVLTAFAAQVYTSVTGQPIAYYRYQDDAEYPELAASQEISLSDLLSDSGQYFWQLDGVAHPELVHRLHSGSLYIHTGAAPLGQFDPGFEPFIARFNDAGVDYTSISCSGHAYVDESFEIIDTVRPRMLFPIHGEHPERYRNDYGAMVLPAPGAVVEL